MEEIKRFSLCVSDGFSTMELRQEGTYVLFSDHVSVLESNSDGYQNEVRFWKNKYEALLWLFNSKK